MSAKHIGIIGSGIGGVTTAVALHKLGFEVSLYERQERLHEAGAGMMLWPNATRVLHELGLLEQVLCRSGRNTHFLVRTSSGRTLMTIALGKFEVPALCIRRADLLSVLVDALPEGCLHLGREFDRLQQAHDKVLLYFEDGHIAEHDAVIGADGIRSRVRSALFGNSKPIYRGYTVWRGLARYGGGAVDPGCNSESWGVGRRFGILNTGHRRFTWYATANVPEDHLDSADGRKPELQKLFTGWHEPVADFIDATDENEILKNGARDCPPLRRWGKGMVTLLGDAAHACTPNLGQGGCMAIEDALVLAKSIAMEPRTETALRRYESLRSHRTSHMQKRSLLIGSIGQWQKSVFVAGREIVTRMLPPGLIERNLRRVYSYQT